MHACSANVINKHLKVRKAARPSFLIWPDLDALSPLFFSLPFGGGVDAHVSVLVASVPFEWHVQVQQRNFVVMLVPWPWHGASSV